MRVIRRTRKIAAAVIGVNLTILAVLAWRTSLWDDEANSFFLARLPLTKLLGIMASNYDEDAPLFNVLEHFWTGIWGYDQLALRALPWLLWAVCLWGVARLAEHLDGRRGKYFALIAVGLWPYHWLYPIALRWYSLAAALSIWNLYFLIRLIDALNETHEGQSARWWFLALTSMTGALLWYTNYAAPVVFLAGLTAAFLRPTKLAKSLPWIALTWALIGVLYAPWMPTFFNQLGLSLGNRFSAGLFGSAIFVGLAGEFSNPWHLWVSLPMAAGFAIALTIAIKNPAAHRIPLAFAGTIFGLMAAFGVIDQRRMLLVTVPLVTGIGMTLAILLKKKRGQHRTKNLALAATLLGVIGIGGSAYQVVNMRGWLSYRWLDDIRGVVAKVREDRRNALLLSNSNTVAQYAGDPMGLFLAPFCMRNDCGLPVEPRVWYPALSGSGEYASRLRGELEKHEHIIYVHHATLAEAPGALEQVLAHLADLGFESAGSIWLSNPISDGGLASLMDFGGQPGYRITAVLLYRNGTEPPEVEPLLSQPGGV